MWQPKSPTRRCWTDFTWDPNAHGSLDLFCVVSASEIPAWSREGETNTCRFYITQRFDLSLISTEFLEVSASGCDPKLSAAAWISELGMVSADLLSTQEETRTEVD